MGLWLEVFTYSSIFDIYRIVQLHARLFGSMRALPHAYLVGSIFCLSLQLHELPLRALGHNNGSDVCASSECPDETVHLPRLF